VAMAYGMGRLLDQNGATRQWGGGIGGGGEWAGAVWSHGGFVVILTR
jgi:hypothetical protein